MQTGLCLYSLKRKILFLLDDENANKDMTLRTMEMFK